MTCNDCFNKYLWISLFTTHCMSLSVYQQQKMEIIRSELVELTSQYVRNVEEKMNNLILNIDEKEKLMESRYEQKLKVGGSKCT